MVKDVNGRVWPNVNTGTYLVTTVYAKVLFLDYIQSPYYFVESYMELNEKLPIP